MLRRVLTVLVALSLLSLVFAADDGGIQKGKIRKVDVEKGIVVLVNADGKEVEATVTDSTRFMNESNEEMKDGLKNKGVKEGAAVMFKLSIKDGKATLVGMKLAEAVPAPGTSRPPSIRRSSNR